MKELVTNTYRIARFLSNRNKWRGRICCITGMNGRLFSISNINVLATSHAAVEELVSLLPGGTGIDASTLERALRPT